MVKHLIFHEFIRKHFGKYCLGMAALIVAGVLQLAVPKVLGVIIDLLKLRTASQARIVWLTLGMLGLSAILFGLKFLWRYLLMGKARDLECFLREKLFAHLQTLPARFYSMKKTGDLMAYAINDLSAIRQAFSFGLVMLVDGVLINAASLLVMARTIEPRLTAIALCPLVLAAILILILKRPLRTSFHKVQSAYAAISDKTQENISGIRVVKAYVQEEQEIEKLGQASLHRLRMMLNFVKLSSIIGPAVEICFGLSFSLVIIFGARYVRNGVISLGDFIAFNTYLAMLSRPMNHLGKIVESWQQALASITRLDEIFLSKPEILDTGAIHAQPRFAGEILLKDLDFSYPETSSEALRGIDLRVPAGKTLAVIGRTGSGKTTLINLLLRLYPVPRGHIFIDGVDINEIPPSVLRENIGYVPQDNFLFSATIRDNINFFRDVYAEEETIRAAKLASVYDNIMALPEGFGTVVGERGITLSGGQKQRIAIARAVIKDPSILVLDDSLSAVDTRTEEEILANIKEILRERTGIIIAHRISTIKHADEIVVMENGAIVERGTHADLLRRKGEYYRLYRAQLAEESLAEGLEDEYEGMTV